MSGARNAFPTPTIVLRAPTIDFLARPSDSPGCARYVPGMCGRAALTTSPEDLREIFGLDEKPDLSARYNVTPSQPLMVRREKGGSPRRILEPLVWGLVPSWADDRKMGQRLALARVETVATTPAFREAARRRRCLVVVDAFYEWKRQGQGKSRPFVFRRPDGRPFTLAGLWERWVSRDGEVVESCAILTQPARPPVLDVHDRMPLVVPRADWDAWLDPERTDLEGLLAPREAELVATEVSSRVNDPRNDDPDCFAPPGPPVQGSLF